MKNRAITKMGDWSRRRKSQTTSYTAYDCEEPGPQFSNYGHTTLRGYHDGTLTITCDIGYHPYNQPPTPRTMVVTCKDYAWSPSGINRTCIPRDCGNTSITHSNLEDQSGEYPAVLTGYCNNGKVNDQTGGIEITVSCLGDGTWGPPTQCVDAETGPFVKILDNSRNMKMNCPYTTLAVTDLTSCLETADELGMTVVHFDKDAGLCDALDCYAPFVRHIGPQVAAENYDVYAKGLFNLAFFKELSDPSALIMVDGNRDPTINAPLPLDPDNAFQYTLSINLDYWYEIERVIIYLGDVVDGFGAMTVYTFVDAVDQTDTRQCSSVGTPTPSAGMILFYNCPTIPYAGGIKIVRSGVTHISEVEVLRKRVSGIELNKIWGAWETVQWLGNPEDALKAVDAVKETWDPGTNCLQTGQEATGEPSWWSTKLQNINGGVIMVIITIPDGVDQIWSDAAIYVSHSIDQTSPVPFGVDSTQICHTFMSEILYAGQDNRIICDFPLHGTYLTIYHNNTNISICEVEVHTGAYNRRGFYPIGFGECMAPDSIEFTGIDWETCVKHAHDLGYEGLTYTHVSQQCNITSTTLQCDRDHLVGTSRSNPSFSLFLIGTRCNLTDIDNSNAAAVYFGSTTFHYGEWRDLECDYGYGISTNTDMSLFAIFCCRDGTTHNSETLCSPRPCPDVVANNSNGTLTGYSHGDEARVVCQNGYVISDQITREYTAVCDNGTWAMFEHCERIKCHATIDNTNETILEAEFEDMKCISCNEGYIYANDTNITYANYEDVRLTEFCTVCQASGEFTEVFSCEPTPCFLAAPAGHQADLQTRYPEVINVSCSEGYITTIDASPISSLNFSNYRFLGTTTYECQCQANGNFSNIQECTKTPCYSPQPSNTDGSSDMEGYYGDQVNITCITGHLTSENGPGAIDFWNYPSEGIDFYTAECLSSGDWSIDYSCTKTPCHHNQLAGTSAPGQLQRYYLETVTVVCSTGYITHPVDPDILDDDNYLLEKIHYYTATCQANGTFDKTDICVKTFCKAPTEANLTTTGVTLSSRYGDTVDQQCTHGHVTTYPLGVVGIDLEYRDHRINVWTIECMSNGHYDFTPACTPTPCYTPQPENTIQGDLHGYLGDVIEVLCIDGYILTDIGPIGVRPPDYRETRIFGYNTTCQATGEWTIIYGCTRTPCRIEAPNNTRSSSGYFETYFGETVIVECELGHLTTLLGTPDIIDRDNYRTDLAIKVYIMFCQADGEFNYTVACVRTPCYHPQPAETVSGAIDLRYGDNMTVNCKHGFVTNVENGPTAIGYKDYRLMMSLFYITECLYTGEASLIWACVAIPCYDDTPTLTIPRAPVAPDAPPNSVGKLVGRYGQQVWVDCQIGHWDIEDHKFGYYTICEYNGNWTRMVVCELLVCPRMTIEHSNVQQMQVRYLEFLNVRCDDAYRTEGDEEEEFSMQCLASAEYTPPKKCIYYICDSLTVPNSDVRNGTTLETTSIEVTCNDGYETPDLLKTFSVRCAGLEWSDGKECIRITCEALTIERTEALNLIRQLGDRVALTCERGYKFNSTVEVLYLECMGNKKWNGTDFCRPVECEETVPEHAVSSGNDPSRFKHEFPNSLLVLCEEGYETATKQGTYVLTCDADGVFQPPPVPCQPKPCDGVPADQRALTADVPPGLFGQSHTAHCRTGHILGADETSQYLTCNSEGKWQGPSGRLRTCNPVRCDPLNALNTNGHMTTGAFGLVLTVTCYVTYRLPSGGTVFITSCQADGTWSRQAYCEKIRCTALDLPHTDINGWVLEANTALKAFCDLGHSAGGIKNDIDVRCDENGFLHQDNLVCEPKACPQLMVRYSNVAEGVNLKYGDSISVVCDVGYVLNVTSPVHCTSEAKLSPVVACQPINCARPNVHPSIDSLDAVKDLPYNSRIRFQCKQGYTQLQGDEVITCLANGTWTPQPYCLKDCEKIPDIENGKKSNHFVKSFTKVRFTCDNQYEPEDPSCSNEATCSADGQWSHVPCKCIHSPVDGYWTSWSAWSDCPSTCDGAVFRKVRQCAGPYHGGRECVGNSTQSAECNTVPCPVDGYMSEWNNWGTCTASLADCAKGTRIRYRRCVQPKHNGRACPQHAKVETGDCDLDPICREKNAGSSGQIGDEEEEVAEPVVEMKAADTSHTSTVTGYVAVSFMCFVIGCIICLDLIDVWMKIAIKSQATKFKVKRESRYEDAVGNVVSITSVARPEGLDADCT